MTTEKTKQSVFSLVKGQRYHRNIDPITLPPDDFLITAYSKDIVLFALRGTSLHGFLLGEFDTLVGSIPFTAADITGNVSRYERFDGVIANSYTKWQIPVPLASLFSRSGYLSHLGGDDFFGASSEYTGSDRIQGMEGADRFQGLGDDGEGYWYGETGKGDFFYGGEGIDTSIYRGKISEYTITSSAASPDKVNVYDWRLNDGTRVPGFYVNDLVARRDGNDRLVEVERLEFEVAEANGANRVALDLDAKAGTAAKILGALWGKDSVENPTFVGIVLHYLDSGVSYEALLDLALGAILGANKTNEAIVELVYTNLFGVAPTDAVTKELASYMDSGAYSQAGFARAIADLDLNATNINLVGLAETGLQYAEYGA
jgi:hypothetical protein